jgi:hypothetical protein
MVTLLMPQPMTIAGFCCFSTIVGNGIGCIGGDAGNGLEQNHMEEGVLQSHDRNDGHI